MLSDAGMQRKEIKCPHIWSGEWELRPGAPLGLSWKAGVSDFFFFFLVVVGWVEGARKGSQESD